MSRRSYEGLLIAGALLLGTSLAVAGKAEREKQKELEPAVKAAAGEVKKACGCEPKMDVVWASFKEADHMTQIGYELDGLKKATTDFCNDKVSKDLFCKNVKKITIRQEEKNSVTHNAKESALVIAPTHQSYNGDSLIRQVIDKW